DRTTSGRATLHPASVATAARAVASRTMIARSLLTSNTPTSPGTCRRGLSCCPAAAHLLFRPAAGGSSPQLTVRDSEPVGDSSYQRVTLGPRAFIAREAEVPRTARDVVFVDG